jgi:uncharacterized membrane protein (UPF0136 family)
MRTFLELFARRDIAFLALLLVVGPIVMFELDSRLGMLLAGVVFGLGGVGHFLAAEKETSTRGLQKALGVFLILFGLFTIVVMTIMFVRGEQLSTSPP